MLKEEAWRMVSERGEFKREIRYGYVSPSPWPLQTMYFLQGILYTKMEVKDKQF